MVEASTEPWHNGAQCEADLQPPTHKKRKYEGEREETMRKNFTTGGYVSTECSKIEIKI